MVENISEESLQGLFEEGRKKRKELDSGRDPISPLTATLNLAAQAQGNGVKISSDSLREMTETAQLRNIGIDEIEEK
ncbi:MAG: hypothetical protein GYA60_06880 [Candidatus Methanofastidiosa archaeon]|nr:hypothetical protein [Candidatus Methanofastidiosa archaeon]